MSPPEVEETHEGPPEEEESLWWLAAAPSVWALHLVATYATVAVACAHGGGETPGAVAWAVSAYTGVAMLAVAWIGRRGLRSHHLGTAVEPHDYDSPGDRHRFLGLAILLLAGTSAIAISYGAVAVALVWTCR